MSSMYYVIMSQDVPNSLPLRQTARPLHLERLEALKAEDRLLLAGPHPLPEQEGFSGSLVVASFDSYDAALQWADADPYVDAGVYAKVVVKPFNKVLP